MVLVVLVPVLNLYIFILIVRYTLAIYCAHFFALEDTLCLQYFSIKIYGLPNTNSYVTLKFDK
jgi:hypothetical protein